MDILNEIKNRKSCRSYKENVPSKEEINKVIEAGLYAASGMNLQTGIIVSITNKEIINELSLLNRSILGINTDPFYGAPVVLLVLVKKDRNASYDGSCMIENMMLEASSIGLGSCWIHRLKQEIEMDEGKSILKSLNLNLDEYEGIGHVILGYPKDNDYKMKEIKENRVFHID